MSEVMMSEDVLDAQSCDIDIDAPRLEIDDSSDASLSLDWGSWGNSGY